MIMDGKEVKKEIFSDLKSKINDLNLSFAIIQIGNDEASNIYIRQKNKMCAALNIEFKHYKYEEDASEEEIITLIDTLNQSNTTGILLQLPIPAKFNQTLLQNRINPLKDVDGLSDYNVCNLITGERCLQSCTAKGIIELLKKYKIEIEGKNAVVVGRSNLVGKPTANLLLNENATVTICHSKTKNLSEITKTADILVVAAGVKHLITEDMVKSGSIVIDVGINKLDGKLYGDVDFENASKKASYISPVPGGVGQMTIAMLAQNIYEAYLLQNETSD